MKLFLSISMLVLTITACSEKPQEVAVSTKTEAVQSTQPLPLAPQDSVQKTKEEKNKKEGKEEISLSMTSEGDKIELKNGQLYINSVPADPAQYKQGENWVLKRKNSTYLIRPNGSMAYYTNN